MIASNSKIVRVCPEQVDPMTFFHLLKWIDGRALLDVMPAFWQAILTEALFTFRLDGSPQFNRTLWGMAKKNMKTLMLVLAGLYKLLAWQAAGRKGNQCYLIAFDMGQANDDLDLTKKLIRCNPILDAELTIKTNIIERKDGVGFEEIVPAGDVPGLHGKTFLWKGHDELHTQRDYRVLEALELDRTRPDAMASFASYAAVSPAAGIPLNDMLKQHKDQTDPRLFVAWYGGTIQDANPALNTPLGPTLESIHDAEVSVPSWTFRRLYLNLPGQPDSAAFTASMVEDAIVKGRTVLPPQLGLSYVGFCDMSGGGPDDATLAIAHRDREGRAVLDLVMDQGSRRSGHTFDVRQTVERFALVLKQYGCSAVTGDRYAGEWPRQAFEQCGVTYRPAELNRSQLYSALEPLLNSGQVELLDEPKLFGQLIGLVRKGEKIDHPNGEHDDHANACAGALVLVGSAGQPFLFSCGGVRLGAETAVSLPVAVAQEPVRPVGKELLAVPAISRKYLSPAELEERGQLVAAEQRSASPVERAVARHGFWWPRT